ncbi:MAG: hypothetical protein US72_C0005G0066 [Microgenomates group bacterium GW2011_GWC1_38_12]|nr:MAG: hypothetical protein US72_C0005G0066 [Microgenomates group bacterium GW2011_GWC1_38_12]
MSKTPPRLTDKFQIQKKRVILDTMKTNILKYNVIIKKEDKYFVAYVPTLGISDFGKSLEEAKKNVKAAITVHVEGLIKTKSEVPPPDNEDFYISQAEITINKNPKFAY